VPVIAAAAVRLLQRGAGLLLLVFLLPLLADASLFTATLLLALLSALAPAAAVAAAAVTGAAVRCLERPAAAGAALAAAVVVASVDADAVFDSSLAGSGCVVVGAAGAVCAIMFVQTYMCS
jgi:hypothetical protein